MTNNDKPANKTKDRLNGTTTLKVAHILDEFEKDDVKKQIDIIELFAHYGIELKKKGKNYIGLCPWHKDTNPSLSVDQAKGVYNCFGCGESGDIFTLTEKMQGIAFKEALTYLKNWKRPAGENPLTPEGGRKIARKIFKARELISNTSTPPEKGGVEKQQAAEEANASRTRSDSARVSKKLMPSPTATGELNAESPLTPEGGMIVSDEKQESSFMLNEVADYYHKKLYDNKEAIDYLHQRGLVTPALWVRYKIGYADGTLPEKIGKQQREQLTAQGIFTVPGNEHFNGCLVFPIPDEVDNTVGIYGRNIFPPFSLQEKAAHGHPVLRGIGTSCPAGQGDEVKKRHLYLKGPHKGIFNRKASTVYDEIILTESIIDALSLIELGIDNVQPIYGSNGFTEEHLKQLQNDRVKTIILALDNDQAGRDASEKLKAKLLAEGFAIKVIAPVMPTPAGEGKDWNDYLLNGGTKETVKDQVAQAENIYIEPDNAPRVEKTTAGYICASGDVIYRVTGVKEQFINNLRVNIKATIQQTADDDINHICDPYYDNVDLYSARSRESYTKNLAARFARYYIEEKRVEKDLITILEYLEAERDRQFAAESGVKEAVPMTEEDKALGMALLTNPDLFNEIVEDMNILGYVGEELNKQLLYIAATSRKLDDPISVHIMSESASGKSMMIDTVAKLMPPDEVIAAISLSEQALNYMEDLTHKFISLGEAVHSETIEHQIREMLSAKELSRLVTTKEPQTGKLVTKLVKTPAIVSLAMSGTRYDMNPENTSRSFVVNTDESREQTRRIHKLQRMKKYTLERDHEKEQVIPEIIRKHHAAQRLLRRVGIVNPYGAYLDFPDMLMRTRRDHDRFIDLIACICFLRQYQKEQKYDGNRIYVECDARDYEIAYAIMIQGVLSSSLLEIPRGVIDLYEYFRERARKQAKKENIEAHEVSLTQREIREYTGLNQVWVKRHMRILVDYEYLVLTRGGKARSRGEYRLRDDVPMEEVNISMIPTPEQMRAYIESKK